MKNIYRCTLFIALLLLGVGCNIISAVTGENTSVDDSFYTEHEGSSEDDTANDSTVDSSSLFSGLVEFWRFEEASNSSRNSLNGSTLTDANSNTPSVTGQIGNAANCNFATNTLLRDSATSISMTTGDNFAIAFWANEIQTPPPSMSWIAGTDSSLFITIDDFDGDADATDIRFEWSTSYYFYDVITGGNSGFEHFVFNIDQSSSIVSLYINGAFHSSQGITPITVNITDFGICNEPSGGTSFYGEIDSFGMWSRLLTVEEIGWLYNGTNTLD